MRKCLIFLLLAAALATGVCAAADVLQEEAAILGADKLEDALPAEAEEALDGISPLEQGRFSDGFKQILAGAVKGLGGWMRQGAQVSAALLAAALLCGFGAEAKGGAGAAVRMAGCLGIATVCTSGLYGMIALAQETLDGLGSFSALLLPVLSSALTASGGVTSGGTRQFCRKDSIMGYPHYSGAARDLQWQFDQESVSEF